MRPSSALGPICLIYARSADGAIRAGKRVDLSIADSCEDFALQIRSQAGTAMQIRATGQYVPLILGTQKTVVRDPKTHLILHVIETPVLVPAP